ncbi:PfkB family carbohydrate kinase [Chondromyces crocatus]|uniref:Uncharacterized protein n=1 Tax=Chondromyces crocatus TaxID=52 RepID=A0A0K1ECU4_CHOCO|nr:PfkB family carbohydrate kinase [Chondromyces crocatus]AKT38398.1 uncharacterized protein CMC5_025440 [Chondromyces crocatus]
MDGPFILSLGSINADFQVRVDEPLESGRTLIASDFSRPGGGKTANVAFLARRLGVPACLLGRVGDDDLCEQALAPLCATEVDLRHVTTARGCPTAVSMIAVSSDGKKSILLATNANDAWDEDAIRDTVDAITGAPDGSALSSSRKPMPSGQHDTPASSSSRDVASTRDATALRDPASSPDAAPPGDPSPASNGIEPAPHSPTGPSASSAPVIHDALFFDDLCPIDGAGPTCLAFDHFDPDDERRRESLFSLGNGILLTRAAAPEERASTHHYPGTYRAGCYDRLASEVEGEPVQLESLVNLPSWLPLTFRVKGERAWFSLHHVEILVYRHTLDMEAGLVTRDITFRDLAGRSTRLREQRLVSMAQHHLAALQIELTPLDWQGTLEIRSALEGDVENTNVQRFKRYDNRHLDVITREARNPDILVLGARTRQSHIHIALASRTRAFPPSPWCGAAARDLHQDDTSIAEHLQCDVAPEHPVRIEKIVALFTSRDPAISEPTEAALLAARGAPDFDALRAAHVATWARLWARACITLERPDHARATRFHTFHLLQTASPHTPQFDVGFPARGWQEAYHGHIFWDELFLFPYLDLRFPELSRAFLHYRTRRLDEARLSARQHGYDGAMFPWRSASTGREETPRFQLNLLSGRWMNDPTRLQRHIGAAIAYNLWNYFNATGDTDFLADHGAELLIEIARFWASIAHLDATTGRYEIRGVIGPDEYHNAYPGAASPGFDNNAYTNLMAVWTLCRALEVFDHLPVARGKELRDILRLGDDELARWDRISRRMRLVFHRDPEHGDGLLSQFEGFERLKPLDPRAFAERHPEGRVDWVLEAMGDTADAYQVTKQADVIMLFYLLPCGELTDLVNRLGYELTDDQGRRTLAYYLARLSHESSLSKVACAGALARIDPAASWDYFQQALRNDLDRAHSKSACEGLHLGAFAGTTDIVQRHYLGIRPQTRGIRLDPAIPEQLGCVRFAFQYHRDHFEVTTHGTTLTLRASPENRAALKIVNRTRLELLRPGDTADFESA